MGRRARNRSPEREGPSPRLSAAVPARVREERPRPPWHPIPLVELCVLAGLVLFVLGVLNVNEQDGRIMLVMGMVLASLGGLDTAVREHFAGFRSHTTVLAALPAVLAAGALAFLGVPWLVLVAVVAAVFAAVFTAARSAFRRRSGGLSYRVR
jgi:lysylphosphatidylglycerol synthetase-like protein (DUF2156 family)